MASALMDLQCGIAVFTALFMYLVSCDPCNEVNGTSVKASSGNSCYFIPEEVGGNFPTLTWTKARRDCVAHGGHLAAVNRSEAMEAVRNLQSKSGAEDLWLGGVRQDFSGFKWDDGSSLTGSLSGYPWSDPAGASESSERKCVYVDREGGWRPGLCSQDRGSICQFDTVSPSCVSGVNADVITIGRSCFLIDYAPTSWFHARAQCEAVGGHMMRLSNVTTYQRLVDQLRQGAALYQGQELWTGLRSAYWVWSTGEEILWTAWERAQPDGTSAPCLVVHKYSASAILWAAAPCAMHYSYVCRKDVIPNRNGAGAPTDQPADRGSAVQNGLLFLLLLLLVVLAVIVIFLICYYRRGRTLRKQARERAREQKLNSQNNNTEAEYRPNLSIFTTSNETNGQLPKRPMNGHILQNELDNHSTPDSLRQNASHADTEALIRSSGRKPRNNNINSSSNNKTKLSKSQQKYEDRIEDDYDFDAEEARKTEKVFKDISNFDPPVSGHSAERGSGSDEDNNGGLKRDSAVYKSSELFSIRSSMRIPMPKTEAGDSMVMESFKADDQEEGNKDIKELPEHDPENDTDRSKYIEDVAKAFDFLVTGEESVQMSPPTYSDNSRVENTPPKAKPPPHEATPKANKDEENLLKRRTRRDSIRSVDKCNYASGNESDGRVDGDLAKAQRRLYGEERRGGSMVIRRKRDKDDVGKLNAAYESEDEHRRRKHKHRSSRDGAVVMTDSEMDEERKKRHKNHRHKYTEEELEDKRKRRKEREQQKLNGTLRDREKKPSEDTPLPDDEGMTRVGSPPPPLLTLGKLPPLAPIGGITKPAESTEHKKKHRHHKHRKHRKDMTPEEIEEHKRRHKRKKEKERRRRERELQAKKVEPNHIQVSGKLETESEDSALTDDSADETGSVTGSMTGTPKSTVGTPKKSTGTGGQKGTGSRRGSLSGNGGVFDIENSSAGKAIEV